MQKVISFTLDAQIFPADTPAVAGYKVWVDGDTTGSTVKAGESVTIELADGDHTAFVQAVDATGAGIGSVVQTTFNILTPQPVTLQVPVAVNVA